MQFTPISAEQRAFLDSCGYTNRSRHDLKIVELLKLRLLLGTFGGVAVVVNDDSSEEMEFFRELLLDGELTAGGDSVFFAPMEKSRCHDNVAALAGASPKIAAFSGFALSEDGIWRRHSWAVAEGRIVETTVVRLAYFGMIMADHTVEIATRRQEVAV